MIRPAKLDTVPREVFAGALDAVGQLSAWAPVPQHASCVTYTFERVNSDAVVTFRIWWRTEDGIETYHSQVDGTLVVSAPPFIQVTTGIVEVTGYIGDDNFDYTVAIPPNKAETRVSFVSPTANPGDVRISVSFA